ncbi:hypothetical protein PPACK8108_LOCUS1564, partial [Phakopsora pachyrhizi]
WVHTQLRLAKGAKGSSSADILLLLLISCSPLLVSNDLGLGPEVELKQAFLFLNEMCDNVYSDFGLLQNQSKNEK